MTVPPGTQPDTVLRLRGKGLPVYHSEANGDLNLRIKLHVPESLTDEERELFRRLHELRGR